MIRSVLDLPRRLLIALVRGYRLLLSPWLGSSCRFEPTCSAYALGALESHGAAIGASLTVYRLLRCGPWCAGGFDPVPPQRSARRSWLAMGHADTVCSRSAGIQDAIDPRHCAAAAEVVSSTRGSSFTATPGPHS